MGRLQGRNALITGAGSGLGAAMAEKFAAEGARVIVADLSGEQHKVAERIGDGAVAVDLDVADDSSVGRVESWLRAEVPRLDVLVNNAGVNGTSAPSHEYSLEALDRVWRVNARGAFVMQQVALRLMLAGSGGGAIVNVASIGGLLATPNASAYVMSKGAVVMMTRTAAVEYAKQGIRVNAVAPGITRTPWIERLDTERVDFLSAQVPQGRIGEPSEVANVAAFLASDEAAHVTGQVWLIDGGRSAG